MGLHTFPDKARVANGERASHLTRELRPFARVASFVAAADRHQLPRNEPVLPAAHPSSAALRKSVGILSLALRRAPAGRRGDCTPVRAQRILAPCCSAARQKPADD
eukprot:TRINITY_DN4179_c0_g1_i1.p2 TRINITY_DN4179_c0_g1~~TRINITY_DN4179_c0_g1_i1.p2  ORF type:complete len:106 (-),score=3.27 TRINITY_DN4179_c0_g1_i1:112-429(-)